MSQPLTLPQARIPLGWAMIQGERTPIEIDMEWMLAFTGLLNRTGGTSGATNFDEYINQFFDAPLQDHTAREALHGIDELRNAQDRAQDPRIKELMTVVDELRNEIAALRSDTTLRTRVASIEDRLA